MECPVKKQFALAVSVLVGVLLLAPLARADGPTGGATVTAEVKKEAPLRFYGFGFDYSLYLGTGLNTINYSAAIDQYFIPSWSLGKLAFKGTRFERMTLS